jgi:hypothetical protein
MTDFISLPIALFAGVAARVLCPDLPGGIYFNRILLPGLYIWPKNLATPGHPVGRVR